jgi:hypothetical protein
MRLGCLLDKSNIIVDERQLWIKEVVYEKELGLLVQIFGSLARWLAYSNSALQIILDLCIPEKELAKTRSQISFI